MFYVDRPLNGTKSSRGLYMTSLFYQLRISRFVIETEFSKITGHWVAEGVSFIATDDVVHGVKKPKSKHLGYHRLQTDGIHK